MRNLMILLSIVSLLALVGCTTESKSDGGGGDTLAKASEKASGVMKEISTLLQGVKDGDTAKAASGKLDGLVTQLSPMMDKVKSLMAKGSEAAGAAASTGAGGALDAAKGLATKAGGLMGSGLKDAIKTVSDQIKRISANKDMLAPLQQAFDKIKGMLPKMGG